MSGAAKKIADKKATWPIKTTWLSEGSRTEAARFMLAPELSPVLEHLLATVAQTNSQLLDISIPEAEYKDQTKLRALVESIAFPIIKNAIEVSQSASQAVSSWLGFGQRQPGFGDSQRQPGCFGDSQTW